MFFVAGFAQVRVEAGCRVQQVADVLKPYGLSLQNYASIREQQIGGFTQVRQLSSRTCVEVKVYGCINTQSSAGFLPQVERL